LRSKAVGAADPGRSLRRNEREQRDNSGDRDRKTSHLHPPSSESRIRWIAQDSNSHSLVYEKRNLVERFISKIKHYRRLATR
jgi:transposase